MLTDSSNFLTTVFNRLETELRMASYEKPFNSHRSPATTWIPLSHSLALMFNRKRLLGWSVILFAITIVLTMGGYTLTTGYVDSFTAGYFNTPPTTDSIWGWFKYSGWISGKWLLIIITRIFAFYISFLLAYSLTTPGYVLLSTAAERLFLGENFLPDANLTIRGILIDLAEGVKIGLYGVLVTFVALFVNFIPILGQIIVFLLYTYYSALMFIDYPASRRRWSLGRKISWVSGNRKTAFKLGFVPALLSMIPVLNVFLLAVFFPVLTIHATVNFVNSQSNPS